jgi:hypothetical protein
MLAGIEHDQHLLTSQMSKQPCERIPRQHADAER